MLETLPKRLVRIGHDRLNGKKLSEKDYAYWRRHKVKLECRQNAKEISDWEKRQILRLHDKGYSVYEIRKLRVDVMKPSSVQLITGINLIPANKLRMWGRFLNTTSPHLVKVNNCVLKKMAKTTDPVYF